MVKLDPQPDLNAKRVWEQTELPPPEGGLRWLRRRSGQAWSVLTDPKFENAETIQAAMVNRYSTPDEIKFYKHVALRGMDTVELSLAQAATFRLSRSQKPLGKALMIGCGTGREANHLRSLGFEVTAVDVTPGMIEAAKEVSREHSIPITWVHGGIDHPEVQKNRYSLIFTTSALSNHLPLRQNRVQLWESISKLLLEEGYLCAIPDIHPFGPGSRHWTASMILKWRWRHTRLWERGDTAISFLGNHNSSSEMVFFHYYQSQEEFVNEAKSAGLAAFCLEDIYGYLLKKIRN